jgi:hypothetical protein
MIFDFFKVLFNKQPAPIEVVSEPEETVNIQGLLEGSEKRGGVNDPPTKPKPAISPPPQKSATKSKKTVIIEEPTLKDINMAEIFLVVIDTTGRVEAKNFQPGIQNFYFIYANDEQTAKQIVLYTFRQRPGMMDQLSNATKATRLSSIVKTVGQGSNFWTYVPFGGQRQPGQQGVPPKPEALLRVDQYGNPSSQAFTPAAPVGGEVITPEDLRGVQFNGADGQVLNKLRGPVEPIPEEAPPMTPHQESIAVKQMADANAALLQQNQAMMAQMAKMMETMTAAQAQPAKRGRKAATAPAAPLADSDAPRAE